MKLVIIGSPGAGKGTQAKRLSRHFNIAHISTGDLLREQIELKTDMGYKITDIMHSGKLVPDEIVIQLLKERIKRDDCKNGYILDGFPRTISQAEVLSGAVEDIDRVIYINVPDKIIINRIVGRRACPKCGEMYHIKNHPPKNEGICNECGYHLRQRKDDNEDVVRHRLEVYHKETAPLVDYYKDKGIILEVEGDGAIDEISAFLINKLKEEA